MRYHRPPPRRPSLGWKSRQLSTVPVTVVGKLAFILEPQVFGWPVRVKKGFSGRRRRAVRRGGLAGSTDWRHRRQRLSGRLASTTPDDRQATRSGAGRGCTASRAAEARPGRLEGRAAPPGGGGARAQSNTGARARGRRVGEGRAGPDSENESARAEAQPTHGRQRGNRAGGRPLSRKHRLAQQGCILRHAGRADLLLTRTAGRGRRCLGNTKGARSAGMYLEARPPGPPRLGKQRERASRGGVRQCW